MFIACHPPSKFCTVFVCTIRFLLLLYLLGFKACYGVCHKYILFHFFDFRRFDSYPFPLDLLFLSNLSREIFESSYIIVMAKADVVVSNPNSTTITVSAVLRKISNF